MEERIKKSFDFAADSTKQLITLSTAILTLTITFGKDVLQKVESPTKERLTYSWIFYLVSILFGILTLLALTGTLDPIKRKQRQTQPTGEDADAEAHKEKLKAANTEQAKFSPTIQGTNIRILSVLQILTFLIATTLVVISGIGALSVPITRPDSPAKVEQLVREKQRILVEALLRRDTAAIDQNLDEDFVLIASLGQVMNKKQLTYALNSAQLTYEAINLDDISVHVFDNAAVGTGHAVIKGKYNEQVFDGQFRFSVVFAKNQANWQAISIQVARVEQLMGSPTNKNRKPNRSRRRRNSRKNTRGPSSGIRSISKSR